MATYTYDVYEVVRVAKSAKGVGEDDLLSMAEAAELAECNLQMIGDRLDNGTLRWFQMSPTLGQCVRRRLLRSEVETLREELAAKKRKTKVRK